MLKKLITGALLLIGVPAFSAPMISEFMADNRRSSIDDDDDRSDWIEIYNPDGAPANLSGWFLTDDPDHELKWKFPAVTLPARGYLVVFASGKNRINLNAPLHTNFRLRKKGGYLALLDANSGVKSEFSPAYPPQHEDVSFGKGNTKRGQVVLLKQGAAAQAIVPVNNSNDSAWKKINFDDNDWKSGKTGVGYDYGGRIGLNVAEMRNNNETVYIRIPFTVANVAIVEELTLHIQYEDGFAAFINGKKIASDNTPATLNWKSGATQNRPDSIATSPVEFSIPNVKNVLVKGQNMLAIHGLNNLVTSSDLLILPELIAYKKTEVMDSFGYMFLPTPRARNDETVPGVEADVAFLQPSQSFQSSIKIELQKPEEANPNSKIHYTLDGTIPLESSPVYSAPLTLRGTTPVKARLVHPKGGMGPVGSEIYFCLQRSLANFSSNLPLIVLENYSSGRPSQGDYQTASMAVIEPTDGRSKLTSPFTAASQVGIKVRGSSTSGRSKASLSLEVQDEIGQDSNLSLLGMPNESDWVLWGPYNFDLTLMHNPFIFELSRQIGRYAPRTRFVEVYLNTGGGTLSSADYYGVYALMEKISRDADRVDVERLFDEHKKEPDVSGGYIFKIDRSDPGDSGFGAAGQNIKYVYPKEEEIERPERDAQQQYVRQFFNEMGTALNASYFKDQKRGYAKYIDVDAAIDHHLLNVVAFNVDALRLSGYMHKPRGGKLMFGPIWDFDRALGSTDGRDNNPRSWRSTSSDRGTDFFNYPWWNRMFKDIDFFQKYIDRFQSLRLTEFSKANINAVIDGMADDLKEAQKRNLAKWNQRPRSAYGGTYQGEVNHMKTWLSQRISFMEQQFVDPPESDRQAGYIEPGTLISLKSKESGRIYYTLDGTDPRRTGGSVASKAILYAKPIKINEGVLVTARVYKTAHRSLTGSNNPPLTSKWSGALTHFYSITPPPSEEDLLISELHYHPSDPSPGELTTDPTFKSSDFEFIEVLNFSQKTLNLSGLTITGEVRYSFLENNNKSLNPGERVLLVRNAKAFTARYGANISIGGVYSGKLSNSGGRLKIVDQSDKLILELNYQDDWIPVTDGRGFSLVAKKLTPQGEMDGAEYWGASLNIHGSPGVPDNHLETNYSVVINEALTHTDLPTKDTVELFNEGDEPVDLSGWFLTDNRNNPGKFRIPVGTLIKPHEFVLFDEDDFMSHPDSSRAFSLSSLGEEIYLFSANNTGSLTGYMHGFEFGAAENGVSFGRWITSDGEEHFTAQLALTFAEANTGPRVGPIVISEIMHTPPANLGAGATDMEFIELQNISAKWVPLFDISHPENTWRLRSGIQYDFPPNTRLDAGARILIVGFDPVSQPQVLSRFREHYQIENVTSIYGPYSGKLNNSGDRIVLKKPDAPQTAPDQNIGKVPYVTVDAVYYGVGTPWPEPAVGSSESIQRTDLGQFGNEPANWLSAAPTPSMRNYKGNMYFTEIKMVDDAVVLTIELSEGKDCILQYSDEIDSGEWISLKIIQGADTPSEFKVTDDSNQGINNRFYRLLQKPGE